MEREKLKQARIAKGLREKRKLPQHVVALELGCSVDTYNMWERGRSDPYPHYVAKLCQYYKVQDPAELDLVPRASQLSLEEIIEMLEKYGRREVLAALQALPVFATIDLSTFLGPAEYLAQARLAIDTAWDDLYSGNYPKVQRAVNAHAQTLGRFANTITLFQAQAASLAVEAKILQALLATSDMRFRERELYCIEAVQFGALSGDSNLLALALFWHGDTFTYCYNRPQTAIPLLNDALKNVSGNSLVRSIVYSDLSIAHAQDHDEKNALDYLEMAYSTMPSHPELDPLYGSIHFGPSELDQHGGKTLLCLAESLPNEYAKKAYDAFDVSTRKQASGKGYQIQALTRKADAARLLREQSEYVNLLTESFSLGPSAHRLTQIFDVLHCVPDEWQHETPITELQREVSNALEVAH